MRFLICFCTSLIIVPNLLAQIHPAKKGDKLSTPNISAVVIEESPVVWRDDFFAALSEAKKQGAPMLVTWRCLPCKQCAAFDKNVLEGSPVLTPLLQQFITVRITDAAQLDERFFPFQTHQDLDLSWWGYFLSSDGQLYGVFGGKDHVSDSTRISEAAFANSLRRVLKHHNDPATDKWQINRPIPDLNKPKFGPSDLAGYSGFVDNRPHFAKQACVHCHQVGDILNQQLIDSGNFNTKRFSQMWPLPENIGILIDRDDGLLVKQVTNNSPAAKIGIKVGDRLTFAGKQKLFGQADFRGVLHRAPMGYAEIPVNWTRDSKTLNGTLRLKDGWRTTENRWRKTVYDGVYGPYLGFFPLKGPNQGKGKLSIKPYMGNNNEKRKQNQWWATGLRPNHEIIEINGRTDDWDSRELLGWFRVNHKIGDQVTVKTKSGSHTLTLKTK